MSDNTSPSKDENSTNPKNQAADDTSPSKREQSKNQAAANDEMIPLILATNTGVVLNYKAMSGMDPQNRTASSLEHRFRKWKARARELVLESVNNEEAEAVLKAGGSALAKRARTVKKSAAGTSVAEVINDQPVVDNEDQLEAEPGNANLDPFVEGVTIGEQGPTEAPVYAIDPSLPHGGVVGDSGDLPVKKANVTKKRVTKSTEVDGEESPAKKRRVVKKGTAKVVKNEVPTKEGEESENANEGKPKAKGRKTKAATPKKPGPKAKAKQPQVPTVNEGQEVEEGVEMEFE